MKLIRLHSNEGEGLFRSTFQEDILIPERAQIALSNACFTSEDQKFTIDTTNDLIQFQLTAVEGLLDVRLQHRVIDNNNLEDFFQEITKKINDKLIFTGKRIGGQYRIALGDKEFNKVEEEGLVNIVFQRGIFYDGQDFQGLPANQSINVSHFFQADSVADANFDNNRLRKHKGVGTTSTNLNTQFFSSKAPLCSGAGTFRCCIDTLTDTGNGTPNDYVNSDNGFVLALVKNDLSVEENRVGFQNTDIVVGIYACKVGQTYRTIVNGVETNHAGNLVSGTTTDATDNDCLEIRRTEGKYHLRVSTKAGTLFLGQHEITNHPNDSLYPAILFKANETDCVVDRVRFTADPYILNIYRIQHPIYVRDRYNDLNDPFRGQNIDFPEGYTLSTLPNTGANPVRPNDNGRLITEFRVIFGNKTLSTYLGFGGEQIFEYSGALSIIDAENPFSTVSLMNNYVVQLLNIELDSYDSLSNGKFNILKVIPIQDNTTSLVNYEANNLTFLDVNNSQARNLRNFQARILDDSLQPVKISNSGVITLLIK